MAAESRKSWSHGSFEQISVIQSSRMGTTLASALMAGSRVLTLRHWVTGEVASEMMAFRHSLESLPWSVRSSSVCYRLWMTYVERPCSATPSGDEVVMAGGAEYDREAPEGTCA